MHCRHCQSKLDAPFLDLGFAPPSNAYLTAEQLSAPETYYPLRLAVCEMCWLVQTEDYAHADELFSADYAYFSSTSQGWLDHAARYVKAMTERLGLGPKSHVVEIASNDGYLLRNFVAAGIPCLGIEPTDSTAAAAEALGIPVLREFFGRDLGVRLKADQRGADLIIGNNVYAHVPDINDFTSGLRALLNEGGTITLEFPHLLRLIEGVQFDTVYHEHFSYLSLWTVSKIFASQGLRIFDVEELPTHGGSLRIFACHHDDPRSIEDSVGRVLKAEEEGGLRSNAVYEEFQARADQIKNGLLNFLLKCERAGTRVAAYGAAAKGNTLLNYAGIKTDLIDFVCDASPSKQRKYLPGSHIPVLPPSALAEARPDVVLILPWNIAEEVAQSQRAVRDWGGVFYTAVPQLAEVTFD